MKYLFYLCANLHVKISRFEVLVVVQPKSFFLRRTGH